MQAVTLSPIQCLVGVYYAPGIVGEIAVKKINLPSSWSLHSSVGHRS